MNLQRGPTRPETGSLGLHGGVYRVILDRWVSARVGYAACAKTTVNRRIRRWLYPRQGPKVPWRGLVRSHRWQEHARRKALRNALLTCRPTTRTDEVTRTPGLSAG